MAKPIKAGDSTIIKLNGYSFGIPKGTEINIAVGAGRGQQVNTGKFVDGDGRTYPKQGITARGIFGVVVHPSGQDAVTFFNEELFSLAEMPVVLVHGGESYTFTGFAVAPSEDNSPVIVSQSEASEAFDIFSLGDKIQ